ncbi:zinc finger protein 628-like isoform X2 [Vespula squamosa]|uniref:Zinc finger protein 628-like isoform X2 n=1 Tax=Vespula squamosa TaxID=30214 RepID=A0ABD2AVC3_VESSQ
MKPELHSDPVGVPVGALSPPATLSPPSSPNVTLPPSPWSPGAPGSSASSAAFSNLASNFCVPVPDRFSAFTLVSGYGSDLRLQNLPHTANVTAREMRCGLMYSGYATSGTAWWARNVGFLLPHSLLPPLRIPAQQTTPVADCSPIHPEPLSPVKPGSPRCATEKAAIEEEVPLNLSTKPNDVSSNIGRKNEIWSPGSVCEREARETKAPSSKNPLATSIINRQIHHSPLAPSSSSERSFQVSRFLFPSHILCRYIPSSVIKPITKRVQTKNLRTHMTQVCDSNKCRPTRGNEKGRENENFQSSPPSHPPVPFLALFWKRKRNKRNPRFRGERRNDVSLITPISGVTRSEIPAKVYKYPPGVGAEETGQTF